MESPRAKDLNIRLRDLFSPNWHPVLRLLTWSVILFFRALARIRFAPALTLFCVALLVFETSGCALISRHQFIEPARDWEARNGQLLYRTRKTTLIGEVLVRFSRTGEFELTFSKGPAVTLLTLRQDSTFAQIKGGLARGGWSGPIANAPQRLRGWLELRMRSRKRKRNPSCAMFPAGKLSFSAFEPPLPKRRGRVSLPLKVYAHQ